MLDVLSTNKILKPGHIWPERLVVWDPVYRNCSYVFVIILYILIYESPKKYIDCRYL